ncbi:MAG: glucoamylase family protein [Candidatus Saelkia tenebricola]|nr:glucoamylase family protein [Candidatus Saelkia tenebricola]
MNKIFLKILFFAVLMTGANYLNADECRVDEAVELLKEFQVQQLNYCYQEYFRINGLYKSSPYVKEVDIATTGFAISGLIVAAEKGLISLIEAKDMALKTINSCINLQKDPSQNYCGFLYHFYVFNEYTDSLEHKSGVEVSTIDSSLLLAGIITAGEYFNTKGYPEVKEKAREFYANINWSMFFDYNSELFRMSWQGKFNGHWDFYTDEIVLIVLLAQGSPNPEYRVDIRQSFGNIRIKKGVYKGSEYAYSWYGSLFTYLFAHTFMDFRRLGKDILYDMDWWQNTKNAVSADISWCKTSSYPKDIFGLSAAWSKKTPYSDEMEYRDRVGAALCGAGEGARVYNDKNGIRPVAPYASIGSLPFFDDQPLLENPSFKMFAKIRTKAVDRSGLLVESLDASKLDSNGIPEVNSHWLVGMDIVFPALMIENYFSGLIWDNFMNNFQVQFALLKTFPGYYMYLVRK